MNRITGKLIVCTALIAIYSSPQWSYARGGDAGGARGGVEDAGASHVRDENVSATNAAESSEEYAPHPGHKSKKIHATVSPCPPQPTLMPGWYIGAQFGYGTYRVFNGIVNPGGSTISANYTAAENNWTVGILTGYGAMLNHWLYLGGEIFIVGNSFDQIVAFNNGTSAYTNLSNSGPTYGAALLPGIKITDPTLVYARLGWNRVLMKAIENVTGFPDDNTSKTMSGFVFGIGIETLITTNYSLRGEFDHMFLTSYNSGGVYGTLIAPSNNEFDLSIIYHF